MEGHEPQANGTSTLSEALSQGRGADPLPHYRSAYLTRSLSIDLPLVDLSIVIVQEWPHGELGKVSYKLPVNPPWISRHKGIVGEPVAEDTGICG